MNSGPLNILALDPSTAVTGAVIVRYGEAGQPPEIVSMAAIDATHLKDRHLRDRLDRIQYTRSELRRFMLYRESVAYDVIAYERDTNRGAAATEAMHMAAGAYLCHGELEGVPTVGIARISACEAAGVVKVYQEKAGTPGKRERLKASVIAWASRRFLDFGTMLPALSQPAAEAIADALAVAEATWKQEERKAAEKVAAAAKKRNAAAARPLFGPGSRGPRAKEAA